MVQELISLGRHCPPVRPESLLHQPRNLLLVLLKASVPSHRLAAPGRWPGPARGDVGPPWLLPARPVEGPPTACEALRPGRLGHGLSLSHARELQGHRARESGSHRLCQDPVSAARRDNGSSQSGSPSLSWADDVCLSLPCDAQVLGTEPGRREPSREASCRPCGSEVGQEDAWMWRASPHVLEHEPQAVTTTPCCRATLCVPSPSVTPGLWAVLLKRPSLP